MPKIALGIQWLPGEALAVHLRVGWRGASIERVSRFALPTPGSESERASAAEAFAGAEKTVAALPADDVFRREVVLPFGDLRRLELAAPLEAEESLPLPLEELVCDVLPVERSAERSRVLVAAAPAEKVGRLLTALETLGVAPQIVDVEALALGTVARRSLEPEETALVVDVSARLAQAVVVRQGVVSTFHAFSARGTDPSLIEEVGLFLDRLREGGASPERVYLSGTDALSLDEEAWSQDLGTPVGRLPFPRAGLEAGPPAGAAWPTWAIPLGLALRAAQPRTASQVNLLRGRYAPPQAATPWRQAAVALGAYAAVLLALWSTAAWIEASNRAARVAALEEMIRATFHSALPEVTNVVSAADQLRAKVSELEEKDRRMAFLSAPETSPLRVLRELSSALPRDVDIELRDVAIDEQRVRLEGRTTSFRESERIKAAVVAADPRFASATSDAKDGPEPGEVLFTLSIDLGGKKL